LNAAAPGAQSAGLPRYGFVLLIFLTIFWGINWPIIKIALEDMPVLTFRAVCLAGGAVVILLLSKLLGHSLAIPRRHWPMLSLCALFNITGWHLLTGYGVDLTSSGRAAIIGYTMPLWAAPLGFLVLGENVTWRRVVALTFGTAGLAILIASDIEKLDQAPLGALFMLAGAISWACGTVAQKRVDWGVPTTVLVGWQYIIGGVPIFIAAGALVDYETVSFPTLWPLLSVLYNILIAFVFCYYAYYEVVRIFPVGIATVGTLATPIVGVFSGALLLGEKLAWQEYSALSLVVVGLGLPVLWRSSRRRRA
jgi:drug/metabolite transporter (DMT)-like permease